MSIQVTCPGCGSIVSAPEEAAGKVARCGSCLEIITVPAAEKPLFELQSEWHEEAEPTRQRAEPIAPRRRRRRRAEPVPQPRTRWVLWLVVGIFLVLLFGGGAIGFAVWKFSKVRWEKHEPAGGGFRVELPAPPRDLTKFTDVKPEPGVNTFGTVRGFPSQEYAIVWVDIDPWQRGNFTDEALLDNTVTELMKDGQGVQKVTDRTLTQNGFPAREVVLRGNKVGGTALFRVVIAETRLYMVIVGGGTNAHLGEYGQRFLNSFEIVDPNLFAARERRLHPEIERAERAEAHRKAEAERAAAKRLADAEAAEAKRLADWTFQHGPYDGAVPPDPTTLPDATLVITFDDPGPNRTARTARTASGTEEYGMPPKAASGTGVRGDALYLARSSGGVHLDPLGRHARYAQDAGQSVSIWSKARIDTVEPYKAGRYDSRAGCVIGSARNSVYAYSADEMGADVGLGTQLARDEGWHHYALIRGPHTGGQEYQALYLDGKLVDERYNRKRTFFNSPNLLQIGVNQGQVPGAPKGLGGDGDAVNVAVDELAVFDRALSAGEVKYLAGRGPKPNR